MRTSTGILCNPENDSSGELSELTRKKEMKKEKRKVIACKRNHKLKRLKGTLPLGEGPHQSMNNSEGSNRVKLDPSEAAIGRIRD